MKTFLKIASVLALVTGLSSCLKDEPIIGGKPQNIVEFYTTDPYISSVSAAYAVYGKTYETNVDGTIDVVVSYSGTETAPQDITVDVAVDPAALTKYNTKAAVDGDNEYELLPSAYYTIPSNTVTIKKGQRRATLSIAVKLPSDFDFDVPYALPLTIKSASMGTISGNFGSVLYNVGGKNKYQGTYHATGKIVLPSATRIIDRDKDYVSAGAATILGGIADIAANVKLTVAADNTVSFQGQVNVPNDVIAQPGKVSTYDPATKTFHLHYQYAGGGGNRYIDEDLVFVR